MDPVATKYQLLNKCREYVDLRIATARQSMDNAQEAANGEGKSSAGDKYETGRAMMQIERDRAAEQLEEAIKLKTTIDKIIGDVKAEKVSMGSLVLTNTKNIFISIGIGKVMVNDDEFLVVAPTSPLGKTLMGLNVSDQVTFNKELIRILEIH